MNDYAYASTFYLVSDYVRTLNLASSRMSVSIVGNLKEVEVQYQSLMLLYLNTEDTLSRIRNRRPIPHFLSPPLHPGKDGSVGPVEMKWKLLENRVQHVKLTSICAHNLVMISMTGLTSSSPVTLCSLTLLRSFDSTVFSSISANFLPMQLRGPAEKGT